MNEVAAHTRQSWRSLLVGGALTATAFVALVGFLHTPAGRPVLAFMAGSACPLGMSRGTLAPEKRESLRRQSLAARPHLQTMSPSRTALGVELGATDRTAITTWAKEHGVSCKTESQGAGLACDGVSQDLVASEGTERGSVYFRFDPSGRVVGVLRMVRVPGAARAAALAADEQRKLRTSLGEPLRATGSPDATYLAAGKLRQARVEHRFTDYAASSAVTNMGHGEYLLTEEAQVYD